MTYLLDTHVWLWMLTTPELLGKRVSTIVTDNTNRLFLSAVSAWEISIKHSLGRLPLPEPPDVYVPERMRLTRIEGLSIAHSHALRVASLPNHHRDPFDRMLIAQAQIEGIPIITADSVLKNYDVELVFC